MTEKGEKVEDLRLPISGVTRIIKDTLPDGVNVSKEARSAIARAASMFVLYLTSAAHLASSRTNRRTITGNDVLTALEETGFEMFIEPLQSLLAGFRVSQQEKKSRLMVKKSETGSKDESRPEDAMEAEDDADEDDEEDEDEEETPADISG